MKHEEIKILLHDYIDGKLSTQLTMQIQEHLSECSDCSKKLNLLKALMKKAEELPFESKPPEDFWEDIFISISAEKAETLKIQEELDFIEAQKNLAEEEEEREKRNERIKAEKALIKEQEKAALRSKKKIPLWGYGLMGAIFLIALFLIYNVFFSHGEPWKIKRTQIGSDSYSETAIDLGENQTLKSNRNSRFQIQVPEIGELFIEPDSKIQRLKDNHVRLFHGSLLANKYGAKQLLVVDVPGAEIKDYSPGGEFKITIMNEKNSFLEAIDGWVTVKKNNLELIVLPNHYCMIKADSGAGLPYLKNSSEKFVEAIDNYCFTNPGNEEALISILTIAKANNSVTLWNLFSRTTRQQRGMVINTIFGLLGELPSEVTVDGLKILDPETLKKLLKAIESKI